MTLDMSFKDQNISKKRSFGPTQKWLMVAAFAFGIAAVFAALSTTDFIAHLDRQMHAIHCAFFPSLSKHAGDSGCRSAMMSPYSSFFRKWTWGGLPISLLALGVFTYALFRCSTLCKKETVSKRETLFVLLMGFFALL